MAAGLVVPVSGPFIGTWTIPAGPTALPLGTLSDDGYELQVTLAGQEITETDAFGMTLVEAIYRGMNWRCRLRGLEWVEALVGILKMFGTTSTAGDGLLTPQLLNVGDRWTKFTNPLTLTAILGNPPTKLGRIAPASPASLTATNAGFAPNSNSSFLLTSKVRELPLELCLFPYSTVIASQTVNVPFTVT